MTDATPSKNPVPMQTFHPLPAGDRYKLDNRTIRIERINDDETVEMIDQLTMGRVQFKTAEGALEAPTLLHLRDAYRDGRLTPLDLPETPPEQQGRYALLDPDACVDRDPKFTWKNSLAGRANADGIKLTDAESGQWLDDNYGREKGDLAFAKPSASTLRRWISKLRKKDARPATLVSMAGRQRGQSQLDAVRDALVHEAAIYYWTRPHAEQKHAYSWLGEQIDAINAERPKGGPEIAKPSREALRQRIHRLRCYDTVKAKSGKKEADRLFVGSDEAVTAVDLLEIGLMDATTLEQVVVFADDWMLPACRVRITALMDVRSHAITGFHVYAGPNRAETSIETIIASMTPPMVPAAILKRHPILGWMFGKYARLLPDNEKALIGPATLPSINEIGIDVTPAPVQMPTAKAALERFWRSLKDALRQCPGTIIDPKRATELDMDVLDSACLTLPQLRILVSQMIAAHNTCASRGLDNMSPAMIWQQNIRSRATRTFEDIARARRVLGRTETALLTSDGAEVNGIRYRGAGPVTGLMNNLAHTQAVRGRRKDGSITVDVKIRISPGNLDSIQVWDPIAEEWVILHSTQPKYTQNLSEWEHREFTRMAKKRREPFASERDRLISKAETMRMIDEMAPKLPFQQRRNMAALYLSQQVKTLAGPVADMEPPVPFDDNGQASAPQTTVESTRADCGLPNTRQEGRQPPKKYLAPQRIDDIAISSEIDEDPVWDDVEALADPDQEIGNEPPAVDENWTEDEA